MAMKYFLIVLITLGASSLKAQKIDSIYFNLYTDSLKKGVHNYINVVGKMADGKYLPLMANELEFSSTDGRWDGNSIILDSSFKHDSVLVTVKLKSKPQVVRTIVIYMKRNLDEGPLKTEEELFESWRNKGRKRNLVQQ